MKSLKIAAAQTFVSENISANGIAIREIISQAASEGVRLVNFCEGTLSGYAKAQIVSPEEWTNFDWVSQENELHAIAQFCKQLGVFAVIGGAHRLSEEHLPHNSLYIISDEGHLLTRYDKRFLSNTELGGWYSPGDRLITFQVEDYQFGCAICIESQFPELFMEYEKLGVDAVLFASYGIPENFQITLRAHAGLNCIWISAATPAQEAMKGPAGIIGPDGNWIKQCIASPKADLVITDLNREALAYEIALKRARPWRLKARRGEIYRERMVNDPRSNDRSRF